MKKFAVIVAGGTGTRMGGAEPKQFMLLRDKPVLYYAIRAFFSAFSEIRVILVLPPVHLERGQSIVDTHFRKKDIQLTTGGDTRFQSVKNGLALVDRESIVFVHDAVRCLVSPELIRRCYDSAVSTGTAVPAVASPDSVRLVVGEGNEPLDRNRVMLVQTPQTFHSKILLPAFQIDYKEKFTDEATVVEAFGMRVSLVPGEETNIKITRPIDLLIAENYLAMRRDAAEG